MSNIKRLFSVIRPLGLFYFFLAANLEALVALLYLFSIPRDPKNSFIAGYSLPRLAVIAEMLAIFISMGLLVFLALRDPPRVRSLIDPILASRKKMKLAALIFVILFLGSWLVIFTPDYRFANYGAYMERLRPVATWLGLFSLQSGIALLIQGRKGGKPAWQALKTFVVTLGILLLIWGLIIVTRLGIKPDQLYWNQPGVPLLPGQVLLTWVTGVILILAGINPSAGGWLNKVKVNRLDVIVFLVIWLAAAFLWTHTPFPGSFFAPGPYPPNQQFYPFSDAAKYDTDAQFAFLGLGMNDSDYTDKPFYSTFLLLLHALFGQRYDWIVTAQVIILAVFPALLYLLGKALYSRTAGVVVAILAIFQEINSISASRLLLSSNSHLLLSEVPTAVGLVLFTYFMARWLKEPRRRTVFPLLAGGALGFCTLIRHNPWLLLVVVTGFSLVVYGRNRKEWFRAGLVFALGMGLAISPWMARSWYFNHTPFYFMKTLNGSFIPSRYYTIKDVQPTPVGATPLPTSEPTRTAIPLAVTKTPGPTKTPRPPVAQLKEDIQHTVRKIPIALVFGPSHFFHNIIASVISLPTSLVLDDLQHTVALPASFWSDDWSGSLAPGQMLLLLIDLVLIASGLSAAWKKWRWVGLIPLAVCLIYFLSNSIARTSGGRYLVPAVWVTYFYFGIGLVQTSQQAIEWLVNHSASPEMVNPRAETPVSRPALARQIVLLGVLLFLIGATLPVSERVFPEVFTRQKTKPDRAAAWLPQGSLDTAGIQADDLAAFLNGENSSVVVGRVLYPRFYPANKGEPDRFSPYTKLAYPRLVFEMIGLHFEQGIILPMASPPDSFQQGIDVIVLGCPTKLGVDAIAVVTIRPEVKVFLRAPNISLVCPAPEPACSDGQTCK